MILYFYDLNAPALKGTVMDKEEILKRGREDGPDEREQKIYLDALNFSGIIVCLICIFLSATVL